MKKLKINIPLVEVLENISGYAKFINDFVAKKHTMILDPMDNTHHCSEIDFRSFFGKNEYLG